MKLHLTIKISALVAVFLAGAMITSTLSAYAAYKPVNLSFPSQLPQAVAGKSYSYTFATRVSGGAGKPYTFSLSGTLPAGLKFSASKGTLSGAIPKSAKNGTYVLKVCATGAKKAGSSSSDNTACKTTKLALIGGTGSSTVAYGSSGSYSGNITLPPMNGCAVDTFLRSVTISESATGTITGTTNHQYSTTFTGSRTGSSITVNLMTQWGARGPYVWQWSGDSLTGTLPSFCWDSSTLVLLSEGLYQFNLTKSGIAPEINASGTYAGNVTTPVMTGCSSTSTFERTVTLVESAGGAITGSTNHGFPTTLTGTRVGSSITVTLQMQFGPRGPYTWQWTGSALTGTMPAFCWDATTLAQLGEGLYQFNLAKR
ncbi:MAG: putative Ig domain-containing protein [Candidatus Nanopelagicaceae bacterium]